MTNLKILFLISTFLSLLGYVVYEQLKSSLTNCAQIVTEYDKFKNSFSDFHIFVSSRVRSI